MLQGYSTSKRVTLVLEDRSPSNLRILKCLDLKYTKLTKEEIPDGNK
jgi:hypothetical protein